MATQKSIAKKLGLSVSLVSRVLSGKAKDIGVAEHTIQKVLEEAKASHYTPNSAARSLKGVKTQTLGVIAYDFEDPYFGIILGELHNMARKRKYTLILAGTYRREQDSLDLTAFAKHNIEGLIIVGSDRKKDWFAKFEPKSIPIVQIGFTEDKVGTNICLDEATTSELIAGHLKKNAVSRMALLFNGSLSHQTYKREHLRCFARQNIHVTHDITCDDTLDAIKKAVTRIDPLPDMILAGDDVMATLLIRALHEMNVSVPKDVKVMGFDDIALASIFVPSLTTVSPPLKDMLHTAFDVVAKGEADTQTLKFSPTIIERESC